MCGFVAVLTPALGFPEPVLNTMRDRLLHRGPDGAANLVRTYSQGTMALGFRRLAVLDPRPVADQPMVSNDGRRIIVFNGEIYNYEALRLELEQHGRTFRTRGDTEVLLQAYEQWGEDAIARLNGMFAFLIWDEDRREAIVARDRFGEKPLFFTRLADGTLIFASEIKALLAYPDTPCRIDTEMLDRSMAGIVLDGKENTPFEGIRQFHAAHTMVVGLDGTPRRYKPYWHPRYDESLGGLSPRALIGRFREQLFRSVARHTHSDVPLTACLSGGLDSSVIAGILSRTAGTGGRRLERTISARFPDDPTIDEGEYIDLVLANADLTGESVMPGGDDLAREARKLHWHHENVIPGASMFLEWCVMRRAKELGFTVIIDGQGADEILAGYQHYFHAFQYDALARDERFRLWLNVFLRDRRLRATASRYEDAQRRFPTRDGLDRDQVSGYWNDHIAVWLAQYGPLEFTVPDEGSAFFHALAIHLMALSLPTNLVSGDRNSMAHGIECRYPYLDYELVDFCMRLPRWAYIDRGWQKRILRLATRGLLPRAVRWRVDKVGFAAPQDRWLRGGALKRWVEDRIFDSRLSDFSAYDRDVIERWWETHQDGTADRSGDLWRWASLAEFLELHASGAWREGVNVPETHRNPLAGRK